MRTALHHVLIGIGSLLLAPFGKMPGPSYRITLPPENATQAIGFDFSRVSCDLTRAIGKVEHAKQLELQLRQ